jgi:hypothetical protein
VRVQVLAEELRRAGFWSRAQEMLQALSNVVGGTLLETVRPAVDFGALVIGSSAMNLSAAARSSSCMKNDVPSVSRPSSETK